MRSREHYAFRLNSVFLLDIMADSFHYGPVKGEQVSGYQHNDTAFMILYGQYLTQQR